MAVAKDRPKDPAMLGASGYEREDDDFYPTIEADWIVPALYADFRPRGKAWECACGKGHLSGVMSRLGTDVVSTDLHDRGYGAGGVDFLAAGALPEGVLTVVTNPPYEGDLVERFISHALDLTRPVGGACAFLVRNEYDTAKARDRLFRSPAFARKIILTKRPRWKEGSRGSPRHPYCWLVWDGTHTGEPVIARRGPHDLKAARPETEAETST